MEETPRAVRKPIGNAAKRRPLTPKGRRPKATPRADEGKLTQKVAALSLDEISPSVRRAQYAVRGRLLDRSRELEAELRSGKKLPFARVVRCNIGNPQALGQKPLTFVRQCLSLLINPELIDTAEIAALYPLDVVERARRYMGAVASVGAYTDSQGVEVVREEVSDFIAQRDGFPADADDIFLTDGASVGVKALMQMLIRGPKDAILAPVPQYPLYSAVCTMLSGTLAPYHLDEAMRWGVTDEELQLALGRARSLGATPRVLVVINPGNPTGQSLPAQTIERLLAFAARERLVIFADEVYQVWP